MPAAQSRTHRHATGAAPTRAPSRVLAMLTGLGLVVGGLVVTGIGVGVGVGVAGARVDGSISGAATADPSGSLDGYCAEAVESWANFPIASLPLEADGTYRIDVPDGEYGVRIVDCTGGGEYLPTWYGDVLHRPFNQPDQDGATLVTITDGESVGGIDVTLEQGATVTGTVTDAVSGTPLADMCAVGLGVDGSGDFQPLAVATTTADGTYALLTPAGTTIVAFFDCRAGTYLTEFWDGAPNPAGAAPLALAAGTTTPGIDAALRLGGGIEGTVTGIDTAVPVEGICVRVRNGTYAHGAVTESDGTYRVGPIPVGTYTVSFLDCREAPSYGEVVVADVAVTAEELTLLDAPLPPSPPGSILGTLTTSDGAPLAGVCAAALATVDHEPRFTGPTGADGTYSFGDVGPGTWYVGFFACDPDDPLAPIPDPDDPDTTYTPQWFSHAPLGTFPDPFIDGALPVVVTSGETRVVDTCFDDCNELVTITTASPGDGTIAVAFDSWFDAGAGVASALAGDDEAACTSAGGANGSTTGSGSPLVVTGLTNGASYTCTVTTTVDGIDYTSRPSAVVVPTATEPDVVPAEPSSGPDRSGGGGSRGAGGAGAGGAGAGETGTSPGGPGDFDGDAGGDDATASGPATTGTLPATGLAGVLTLVALALALVALGAVTIARRRLTQVPIKARNRR